MTKEDPPTDRMFTALAAVLAAIEDGKIAEAEVDDCKTEGESEHRLIITVRKEIRPMLGKAKDDE